MHIMRMISRAAGKRSPDSLLGTSHTVLYRVARMKGPRGA